MASRGPSLAALAFAALGACRPPPPAPSDAGSSPEPPKAQPFAALAPGARCAYEVKEVGTETGRKGLFAAHELRLEYTLTATRAPSGLLGLEARVTRVRGKARRDAYDAELDSDRRGDRLRVQGGADTQVLTELVVPFALLDLPLRFNLDASGRRVALEGGEAARARLRAMFPPAPRERPETARRIEEVLGDEALTLLLVPNAALLDGAPVVHRQVREAQVETTLLGLAVRGRAAVRPSLKGSDLFLEYRANLVAAAPAPPVPTVRTLLDAERSATVRVTPPDPCPAEAGTSEKASLLEPIGEEVEALERLVTRLWTRQGS
jgi:hypothetical protein